MSDAKYISQQELLSFINGNLDGPSADRISRMANEDPFLADAIEGLRMFKDHEAISDVLESLNRDIRVAAGEKQETKEFVLPLWGKALAAAAVVLAFFVFGYNYVSQYRSNERIFTEKFEPFVTSPEDRNENREKTEEIIDEFAVEEEVRNGLLDRSELEAPVTKERIKDNDGQNSIAEVQETVSDKSVAAGASNDNRQQSEFANLKEQNTAEGLTAPKIEEVDKVDNRVFKNSSSVASDDMELNEEAIAVVPAENIRSVADRNDAKSISSQSMKVQEVQVSDKSGNKKPKNSKQTSKDEERSPVMLESVSLNSEEVKITGMLMEASGYYQLKNYLKAIAVYEEVLRIDPDNFEANFYAAVSLLADSNVSESNVKKAVGFLNKVVVNENNEFFEAGLWYRALAMVKMGKESAALLHLNRILEIEGVYKTKAEEMILELKD